jgi:excisionase family DNA binding protein
MKTEKKYIDPLLLSKQQFADRLGVCLRTVSNLIAAREVATVRIGRRVLIPLSQLSNFSRRGDHSTRVNTEAMAS